MGRKTRGAVGLALLASLPLVACGNALEGGSSPSGSYIRVLSIVADTEDAFTPDLYLTECSRTDNPDGTFDIDYEDGLHNHWVDVTLANESRPNTPEGATTNSFVAMTRYQVDYVGVSKTVSIPSVSGSASLGLQPDGTGTMSVLTMGLDTLEYIRDTYPTVGNTESLTLRVRITMWGEDAFQVPVRAEGEITVVVDNYNRC